MSKTYMLITFVNNINKNYFNKIRKDTTGLQDIPHKSGSTSNSVMIDLLIIFE